MEPGRPDLGGPARQMADNAYDLAHRLARALADSEEYATFLAAQKRLADSPTAMAMIIEFGRRAMQAQAAGLVGEPVPPEQLAEMQRLGTIIALHADAGSYLMAEARLGRLLGDVQKVLADALPQWYRHLEELARSPAPPSPGSGGDGARPATTPGPGEAPPPSGGVSG